MIELKYYIFFLGTGLALLLAVWAAVSEKITKWVFAGFLLSTMYIVDINFMSHEWYGGSTRGFEFSVSDLMLIVLLGAVLVRHFAKGTAEIRTQWLPAGSVPLLVFIGIAALSLSKAGHPLYGLFELNKLLKGYLIFWAICNLAQAPDFRRVAFGAVCLIASIEIAYGAFQHFRGGYRIVGTFPHPNSYAMYLNMIIPILLAGALRMKEWKKSIPLFGLVGGGTAAVILTFSRGGWIALGLAFLVVFLLTIRQEWSMRTVVVIALSCLLSVGLVLKALPHMVERWTTAPEASLYSRLQMNQAGYLMVSQSPWVGIGLNNSAAWFAKKEKDIQQKDLQGPEMFNQLLGSLQLSKDQLAKEIQPLLYHENGTLIHNIYLVTTAETGVIGLIAFLLIGGRFLVIGGQLAVRKQSAETSLWMIGIFAGLLAVYFQGVAEWEIRQTPIFYMFSAVLGLLIGARSYVQSEKQATEETVDITPAQTRVRYA